MCGLPMAPAHKTISAAAVEWARLVADDDIDAGAALAVHRQPFDERPRHQMEVLATERGWCR